MTRLSVDVRRVRVARGDEARPRPVHGVGRPHQAREAPDGGHVVGDQGGLVDVVGLAAKVGAGEGREVVLYSIESAFCLRCQGDGRQQGEIVWSIV